MVGHSRLVHAFLDQTLAGYQAFVGQVVGSVLEAETSWSRVQGGVGLLRLCALPRLLHLFRALPPAATLGFAEKADQATLDSYEKLLTAKLITQPQQTQAALPTRLGGSGLLRFRGLRAQAWLGAWLARNAPGGPGLGRGEAGVRRGLYSGSGKMGGRPSRNGGGARG